MTERPVATWLLVAGDPGQTTGGYLYDARIAEFLRRAGRPIDVVGLPGRFPDADSTAANALDGALAACRDGATVVIDGLVLGSLPEVLAKHACRLNLVALIHHPLADEYGIGRTLARRLFETERLALALVARIVVTSRFTARHLVDAYGVAPAKVDIVEPGVDRPPPPEPQSSRLSAAFGRRTDSGAPDAPRMLCVATVVPRKGHLVLVEALSQIADLAWYCVCVGDTRRDPAHAAAVRAAIRRRGLATRVQLAGIISPEALRNAYRRAWLFVLPSYYEGYGMTIAEALTYGLPVVTTTGGALGETLPREAGVGVPPGDASALARALRRLLCDTEDRASMSAGARRAVNALASWDEAGRRFAAALDRRAAP